MNKTDIAGIIVFAVAVLVAVIFTFSPYAHALTTFITDQGGTGTSSPSGILYGDNGATSHLNTVTIGSNLTFSGGTLSVTGGSGGTGVATTSLLATFPTTVTTTTASITFGNLFSTTTDTGLSHNKVLYTSNGGIFEGVATTSVSAGTGLTGTLTTLGSGDSFALDLTHANTWAGVQTFGGTATPTINNGGNGLLIYNSAGTYSTRITTSNWTGSHNLAIPLITGNDTLPTLGLSQTFTGANTFNGGVTVGSLAGFIGGNSGSLYAFATSSIKTSQLTNDSGFLTGVTADTPLSGSGTSASHLVISQANGSTNGYLSSTDWNTFNQKIGWGQATSTSPNQLVYTNPAGLLVSVASSSLSLPNTALQNSTISGIALGSNLADLTATNATLTFSGTYNGSTAQTIGLNLGNANIWTALQQFSNASSTQFSAASQTFYIDSSGNVTAKDTTNGWTGTLSPTHYLVVSEATSTTWVGTTTGAYTGQIVIPFNGTVKNARCRMDTYTSDWHFYGAFSGWVISASSTIGTTTLNASVNNGSVLYFEVGNPSNAAATSTTCTLAITES